MTDVGDLPLSALASHLLVAYTIEVDNELEQRMLEAGHPGKRTSFVMWASFMRHLPDGGIPMDEFSRRSGQPPLEGTGTSLLERHGWVVVERGPPAVLRPTAVGRSANAIWRSLLGVLEDRWIDRFGAAVMAAAADDLEALANAVAIGLPDFFHPLAVPPPNRPRSSVPARPAAPAGPAAASPRFFAGLSRVLLAFTSDFGTVDGLSLAVLANFIGPLDGNPIPMRDLPLVTGIGKEAVEAGMRRLERAGHVAIEAATTGRGKAVRLTSSGEHARSGYHSRALDVERLWEGAYGEALVRRLRRTLEHLGSAAGDDGPLLAQGLAPHPDGWRSQRPYLLQTQAMLKDPAAALPDYPMLVRQGGWPDGA